MDTNVVLDVLLNRKPHVAASSVVWAQIEKRRAKGFLAAHAITTIDYLASKQLGSAAARKILTATLQVFSVAAVDEGVIRFALDSNMPDFEDAVAIGSALRADCDFIITRDPSGFRGAPIPCFAPEAALPLLLS